MAAVTAPSTQPVKSSGLSVGCKPAPGPIDLSSTPDDGPSQPVLKSYPETEKSGRKRSFRAEWYQLYPWIEYSQIADASFCFACRHFPVFGKDAEPAFISVGFKNWKKAHYSDAGFPKHVKCDFHMSAMVMWQEYKQMKNTNSGSVLQLQNEAYATQVNENRYYLKTIAEVLLLTATQNLAQRGHREDIMSAGQNPGNFLAVLQLIMKRDKSIASRFSDISSLSRYTSKDIQNEILTVMADMVREQIIEEVKQSVYFSVLLDETKDISKQEQLSFVLRFFANGKVHEGFLDFKRAIGLDAHSLATQIIAALKSYGLDISSCLVGQGYDGASVMSGANRGVQQKVRESAPLAIYTHCFAHRLNLVLVDSCKSVPDVANFFALVEKLYVFSSGSVVHSRWIEIQKQMYPGEQPRQLQRLSDTRWACRVVACRNIRDRLDALLCTLHDIACNSNGDRAVEASGLIAMMEFKFVFLLHLFCDLLGKIHVVSNLLQSSSIDLSTAVELTSNLLTCMKEIRQSDDYLNNICQSAKKLCNECNITSALNTSCRTRKLPARFACSVVNETVGHTSVIDTETAFRQHVFLPILDCINSELERRFSAEANTLMVGIQALAPKHHSFLDRGKLEAFSKLYRGDIEDLGHEIHQLKRLLERTEAKTPLNLETMLDLARFLEPFKLAFQEIFKLLNIALVLPVSSAACERSFSALKLIKTHLRSTMCDSRLTSIAVLSVERVRALGLNLDDFVDEFDARHDNRKLALH